MCCSIVMVTSQALTMRYGTTYTYAVTTLTFDHFAEAVLLQQPSAQHSAVDLVPMQACGLAIEACTGEGRNPTDARHGKAD